MTVAPRTPWGLILALYAAGLVAALQYAKLAVPFGALALAYPDAGAWLGWAVSLLSLLGVVLGVIAGRFVADRGFRRSLLLALWAACGLSLLQALLPPLPVFFALRIVEGLSHLAIVVAAPTFIAEITPERSRPAALTLWGSFFGVAFAVTALLGLPVAAHHGLAPLLLAHAGFAGIMALVLTALLPRLSSTPPRTTPMAYLREHLGLYRSPFLSAPAIGWLFYTLTFVSLLAILPQVLPDMAAARFATLAPLAGIAVSMTLGTALMRVCPAIPVVQLGFAAAACLMPLVLIFPQSAVPGIAVFAALGLVQGASFAAIPQLNPDLTDRARANGALAQMGNAGNLLGTPLMLAVLAGFGPTGMILATMLLYLAAIAAHAAFARARRTRTETPA